MTLRNSVPAVNLENGLTDLNTVFGDALRFVSLDI